MFTIAADRQYAQGRRQLIPDPIADEEQYARFYHRDLDHLTNDRIWAEKVLITQELAERLYAGRPRMIWIYGGERVSDVEWLRDRLAKLKTIRAAA